MTSCELKKTLNESLTVVCFSAAWFTSFIQRGLPARLLSERWGKVSIHIRKHPLQQDPKSLLERSTAKDVHGRTERHPDVGLPLVTLQMLCSDTGRLFLVVTVQETY